MKIAFILIACIGLVAGQQTQSKKCLITEAIQKLEGYINLRVGNHVAQSYDPQGTKLHKILKKINNDDLIIQAQYDHFDRLSQDKSYNRVSLAREIINVLRPKVRNGFGIVNINPSPNNDPDLSVCNAINELDGSFINKDDSSGNLFLAILVELSSEGFLSEKQRNSALSEYLGNKDAYVTARSAIKDLRRSRVNQFCTNAGTTTTGAAGSNGLLAIKNLEDYIKRSGNKRHDPHGDILRGILGELENAGLIGTHFKDAFVNLSKGKFAGKRLVRLAKIVLDYVEVDEYIQLIEQYIDKVQGNKKHDPNGNELWALVKKIVNKGTLTNQQVRPLANGDRLVFANGVFEKLYHSLSQNYGIELC